MHIKRFIPSAKHWAEAKCSGSVCSLLHTSFSSVANKVACRMSPVQSLLLTAALIHNHVFVVSEEHLSVLIVEHTERTHLGRRAAGRNHAVRVEMLQ